jgi:hypothetical protein
MRVGLDVTRAPQLVRADPLWLGVERGKQPLAVEGVHNRHDVRLSLFVYSRQAGHTMTLDELAFPVSYLH